MNTLPSDGSVTQRTTEITVKSRSKTRSIALSPVAIVCVCVGDHMRRLTTLQRNILHETSKRWKQEYRDDKEWQRKRRRIVTVGVGDSG